MTLCMHVKHTRVKLISKDMTFPAANVLFLRMAKGH